MLIMRALAISVSSSSSGRRFENRIALQRRRRGERRACVYLRRARRAEHRGRFWRAARLAGVCGIVCSGGRLCAAIDAGARRCARVVARSAAHILRARRF